MSNIENNIINELGLDKLPKETQVEVLSKMMQSVLKRITVEVLERLSEEDRSEFEKLQENAKPEEFDAFLSVKIDDYDGLINRVVSEFKDEMKSSMDGIKKSLE